MKLNPELTESIKERKERYKISEKKEFDLIRIGNHIFADDIKDYINSVHYSNRETYYRFIEREQKSELDFLNLELSDLNDTFDKIPDYKNIILWNIENFYPDDFDNEFRYWNEIEIQVLKNIEYVKGRIIQETFFDKRNRDLTVYNSETNESNNPEIFTSKKAEEIFNIYIKKYIIDPYTDYSFIFQQMKGEKLIHRLTHSEFADWLLKQNYISEKDHIKIWDNKGFKSLSKSTSTNRLNNYLLIMDEVK